MRTISKKNFLKLAGIQLFLGLLILSCAGTKPYCKFEGEELSNLRPKNCADSLEIHEKFPDLYQINESEQLWTAPLFLYYRGKNLILLDTIPEVYDIIRRNRKVSKFPEILPWKTYHSKDGFHIHLKRKARILIYVTESSGRILFALDFGKLKQGMTFYLNLQDLLQASNHGREYSFNLICDGKICARIPFSFVENR